MLELLSIPLLVAGGSILFSRAGNWTDRQKLEKIFVRVGLVVKEGDKVKKLRLLRKTPINDDKEIGMEYVYQIPLGISMDEVEEKYAAIRDGINIKREGNQKHVEMDYDGALRIKIYERSIKKKVEFTEELLIGGWNVPIGENHKGFVYHDHEKIPHLLIAGTTRYGKTVFLKNLITSLIAQSPERVKFTLIDLKGGLAFSRFERLKQVHKVATDPFESKDVLLEVEAEIRERLAHYRAHGFEDAKEAKEKIRHFIIVDEGAQISSKGTRDKETRNAKIECERIIDYIASVSGGVGYRLVFATQYPLRENLSPIVKQQCDAKLVFRLQNETASRVAMDAQGAEKLPRKDNTYHGGRAIYMTDAPTEVQTPFIDNDTIEKLISPHKVVKTVEVYDADQPGENRTDIIEFR
ncbi:hypothetical protein BhaS171_00033 [Bacillus phage vB_BhaS-171]|uniref:FtsK/SpoIIIE-like protein n=1 Tax=Bacillus phage vB_BhaS-171 TaxID=1775140 RepID=UPI000744BDCB|nr:FtsK/SpoIIIE-like protein [Bacillus phage vB_BhaS-171]ALY08089.1 hypothetical protein BhaS171_00033 [Bacillus phage vB_BhaS-171]